MHRASDFIYVSRNRALLNDFTIASWIERWSISSEILEKGVLLSMKFVKNHVMKIDASPDLIFPLLCPAREAEWIDGWSCEMIHSESGLAELGCVFKTNRKPENEAYWIMSRCCPPCEAEYIRFVTEKMFVVLNFKLAKTDFGTAIDVMYAFTGVTEVGNLFVETKVPQYIDLAIKHLEASLNHFVRTGEKLLVNK